MKSKMLLLMVITVLGFSGLLVATDAGVTARIEEFLDAAADLGDAAKVTALLSEEVHVNVKDSRGMTALMCAAGCKHLDVVKDLITAGAEVNAQDNMGFTALMYALVDPCEKVIQHLLPLSDLDLKNTGDQTAEEFARAKGDVANADAIKAAKALRA